MKSISEDIKKASRQVIDTSAMHFVGSIPKKLSKKGFSSHLEDDFKLLYHQSSPQSTQCHGLTFPHTYSA